MRHVMTLAAGPLCLLPCLCPQPATAQTVGAQTVGAQTVGAQTASDQAEPPSTTSTATSSATAGVLVYPPEFFASSNPNTAFDMIQRLPGFALDTGNSSTRGLSGASGNVLIDGDRPSSKSDTLDEVLRRIAAASVERVELIRGGAPGIDMQGRSVVANIVLKRTATTEKVIEANAYLYPDGYIGPQLKGQYSRREGDKQSEAAFFTTTDRTGGTAWGTRRRYDAAGNTLQDADLSLRDRYQNINGRGSIQRIVGGGKLHLNALANYESLENSQRIDVVSGSGTDSSNRDVTTSPSGELGANWTRALGARSDIELTALQRLNKTDYRADSFGGGSLPSTFTINSTSGESVARGIYKFRPNARVAFEGGGEIAYNFLDSATGFTQGGTPVALPNASVFVSELRGEAFGQATWHPDAKLTVEAGLRVEFSTISQTGDADLSRSFVYPKPRLQVTWLPAKGHQIRLRVEQSVGQLDFGDFVASTEVNLGTVNGGNAQLRPQQDLVFEAIYEKRFWNKGVAELSYKHREATDVIDIIPLAGGFDAVGNIGKGSYDRVSGTLTLPLDRLGLKNALLSGRATVMASRVIDPLTGQPRRFSGEVPFGCGISFSHDLKGGRFSYGGEHGCNVDRYNLYRVRELRMVDQQPFVSIYAQWKPRADFTVRLDLGNATDFRQRSLRDVYAGPRNAAPLLFREERQLRRGQYLFVQLRKIL